MSDDPGAEIQIAGRSFPRWMVYVGGVGVVAVIVLVLRNKSAGVGESDTSTSLLASELDQRLQEQWERWQSWLEDYMSDSETPVPGVQPIRYIPQPRPSPQTPDIIPGPVFPDEPFPAPAPVPTDPSTGLPLTPPVWNPPEPAPTLPPWVINPPPGKTYPTPR